jgi:hypothetical protein
MINIYLNFPQGGQSKTLGSEYATDPKDALYTVRTQMFSGTLEAVFPQSRFGSLLYKGRPLIITYQSQNHLLFGRDAIEMAEKDQAGVSGDVYKTKTMDPDILSCFSSLLSQYPVFRNFSPRMLIVDELFNRMVDDGFSGCLFINTWNDSVLLFVQQGMLLDSNFGVVSDRFPINEAPVTQDMAKAMSLMGEPTCSLDIYETPENLFSYLASLEFGISFTKIKSIGMLKESLTQIARDELKAKSVDFDNALADAGNDVQAIEFLCSNLENSLTINFPRRTIRFLTEKMNQEIAKFKSQH